jgi:hypothetical protein
MAALAGLATSSLAFLTVIAADTFYTSSVSNPFSIKDATGCVKYWPDTASC